MNRMIRFNGRPVGFLLLAMCLFLPSLGMAGIKICLASGSHWAAFALIALLVVGFFIFLLYFALRIRRARVVSGARGMRGCVGTIEEDGRWVMVQGERWRFHSEHNLKPGQSVRICRVVGLTVLVEPVVNKKERVK